MKSILFVAAVVEALTGLALLLVPSLVAELLLGVAVTGVAIAVARVAGLALVGLAIACWPGPPRTGMLVYSTAVGVYLAWLGVSGSFSGVLLWPAVAAHIVLSILLARSARSSAN